MKNQSVIKKIESAIDDLIDLWKRRKVVSILVLAIIISPSLYSFYLKLNRIPKLESKIVT